MKRHTTTAAIATVCRETGSDRVELREAINYHWLIHYGRMESLHSTRKTMCRLARVAAASGDFSGFHELLLAYRKTRWVDIMPKSATELLPHDFPVRAFWSLQGDRHDMMALRKGPDDHG